MWRILVVSDTHGEYDLLNKIIILEKPNQIIHAGDHLLSKEYLINNKILFVQGNNDIFGKDFLNLQIKNKNIIVTHGHNEYKLFDWHYNLFLTFNEYKPDIIIYGHSHKEIIEKIDNTWIINPGSLNYPRNLKKQKSYIIIEINQNKIDFLIKYLKDE